MEYKFDKSLELISFKLCPFANRSVVTLTEKGADFDISYVDILNMPDWFKELSPLGKVPALRVDNTVIFESAVINEFVDEIFPGSLQPETPLARAHNRAWIEFGGELLMDQFQLFMATDTSAFNEKISQIHNKFQKLESQLSGGTFLNGEKFCLIDAAYAPLFLRFSIVNAIFPIGIMDGFPKIQRWSSALLMRDSVKTSVVKDFSDLFLSFFANGHMVSNLFSGRIKQGVELPFSSNKSETTDAACATM